jgi:hypothetical protein
VISKSQPLGAVLFALAGLCVVILGAYASATLAPEVLVTVTAYGPTGRPTASGVWPHVGMVALSWDIERAFALHFGERVCLGKRESYVFTDRMPRHWHRRVDIFLPSATLARHFGRRLHVAFARCGAAAPVSYSPMIVILYSSGVATVP